MTISQAAAQSGDPRVSLVERYQQVRAATLSLCEHLEPEDYVVQSMRDTSPTKWHLAHITWFFERFVLNILHPPVRRRDYCHRPDFYNSSVNEDNLR